MVVGRTGMVVTLFGLLAACSVDSSSSSEEPTTTTTTSLSSALSSSAAKANVPRDLLIAIAKIEDGLTLPAERSSVDEQNEIPAAGPLQLRRGKLNTLARGAELVHASEVELRAHGDLALEAGALVLSELGSKTHATVTDLASWSDAIGEMSGFSDEAHREHYVHRVFALLARGGTFAGRDGEASIELTPHPELPPTLTLDVSYKLHVLADQVEYPGAEWIPTSCNNKCTVGRGGKNVEMIVIHDTEGNWEASVATLQNDPDKSVQYIVGTEGRVAQFVTEETTAWHAGNFNFNQRSVGIEHVGYADKPFTEEEYAASAKLVDYLAKKYNVPKDRSHIIGHDQVPNGNKIASTSAPCATSPKECAKNTSYGGANHHTDPGIWEWATFMARFDGSAKCNDVTSELTCSNDKKQAFRCLAGSEKVDVLTCSGACAGETTNAVCNVAPASAPPAEPPKKDTTEPTGFLPPASNGPARGEDSGCSTIPARNSSNGQTGGSAVLVLLGLVAASSRLRRRSK